MTKFPALSFVPCSLQTPWAECDVSSAVLNYLQKSLNRLAIALWTRNELPKIRKHLWSAV